MLKIKEEHRDAILQYLLSRPMAEALETPEAGVIEFDGDNFYITI